MPNHLIMTELHFVDESANNCFERWNVRVSVSLIIIYEISF